MSLSEPRKYSSSVRTLSAEAPPETYVRAMDTGLKLAVRGPLLGDACLTSAIIAGDALISASRNLREAGRSEARRSKSAPRDRKAGKAAFLVSTMRERISGIVPVITLICGD